MGKLSRQQRRERKRKRYLRKQQQLADAAVTAPQPTPTPNLDRTLLRSNGPQAGGTLALPWRQLRAKHGINRLAALRMELLEAISSPLDLRGRIQLTSCCAALWRRSEVAGSIALWGDIEFSISDRLKKPRLQQPICQSVISWLWRRRHALQRLHVLSLPPAWSAPLIAALEGGNVKDLALCSDAEQLGDFSDFWALQRLPGLQRIQLCCFKLRAVPGQLTAFGSSLSSLCLSGNPLGQGGEAAWQPLSALTALTALELDYCWLTRLPSQVSILTAMKSISLGYNPFISSSDSVALAPLQHLTVLTHVSLANNSLEGVLDQLSALPASLVSLDLNSKAWSSMSGAGAGLEGLVQLTALTRLDMHDCGLETLPAQLSALQQLAHLRLSNCFASCPAWQPDAMQWFSALSALTYLDLSGRSLGYEPAVLEVLAHLQCLRCLDLRSAAPKDPMHRGCRLRQAAWQPLAALTELTRLSLHSCNLCQIPQALQAVGPSLVELDLSHNYILDCRYLPASLTSLDLSHCNLQHVPKQLSALAPSLRQLRIMGNRRLGGQGKNAFASLQSLSVLVRLDLRDCALEYFPRELAALTAVTSLLLSKLEIKNFRAATAGRSRGSSSSTEQGCKGPATISELIV